MSRGERWIDPMPPGGLSERVYCGVRARYGYWPKDFLHVIATLYRGQIPQRFEALAARLQRDRPWEIAERRGFTITHVHANGARTITLILPEDEP